MNLLFIVNNLSELVPTQTSFMMVEEAKALGNKVEVVDLVKAIGFSLDQLAQYDVIFSRTNPGRDTDRQHLHVEIIDRFCNIRLVDRVVNDPRVLKTMLSKMYLMDLPPALIPISKIAEKQADVSDFLRSYKEIIIKPLIGSRGSGVVKIANQSELQSYSPQYPVLMQEFITANQYGDSRVVIVNGERLQINGKCGGILRVPQKGSILGNLHAGAKPHPLSWDSALEAGVQGAEKACRELGLALVGADFCGGKLIELNVYSPGGLYWAEKFHNLKFVKETLSKVLSKY